MIAHRRVAYSAGMESTPAHILRSAVRELHFDATADALQGGRPVGLQPNIDLAVALFPRGKPPLWANLLFSREHPAGIVGLIGADAGAVQNIRFEADLQDNKGDSIAWLPGADWQRLPFQPLVQGDTRPQRFVAPYPASLLKLMVAVGIGLAVDRELATWPAALEPMIVLSDNDATTECVALLHRVKLVDALNRRMAELGLATLQLGGTKPDGGWRNADGAGVGHIHMTAWDTVRLLWLLDAAAPPPPWLPPGSTLLKDPTRAHLHGVLRRQQLDHVLSSGSLRDVPGWVPGLPDAPAFAHKTGNTQNYASDAGIVQTGRVHYLVAVLTNLGTRYAPDERCATTWRLPTLGAAVHRLMEALS
jgi:Beta-lactamase enzyme family